MDYHFNCCYCGNKLKKIIFKMLFFIGLICLILCKKKLGKKLTCLSEILEQSKKYDKF